VAIIGVVGEGLIELGLEPDDPSAVVLGFGGDAPNAAVMAALLGAEARIGGRIGGDALGSRLAAFWERSGVDVSHVIVDGEAPTGIYVNQRAEGLHRFDYHRRGSAGSCLEPADLAEELFADLGALHTTGISLALSPSSCEAAQAAAQRARDGGALVSFAVNHRPALGGSVDELRSMASGADVVFASADEVPAVFGTGAEELPSLLPLTREIVVTHGAGGASVHANGLTVALHALELDVVDAAGAGDALAGAYLATRLDGGDPDQALSAGITAASLSCRARGCALSYPTAEEIETAMGNAGAERAR
jgi:2-dehydro-3-deoxygluconokinase